MHAPLSRAPRDLRTRIDDAILTHYRETLDPRPSLRVVAKLKVAVLTPVERVHRVTHTVARFPEVAGGVIGSLIVTGDQFPHPMLDEDMRRHMTRMGHGRSNLCVPYRRL